jgi:hypothetical protein
MYSTDLANILPTTLVCSSIGVLGRALCVCALVCQSYNFQGAARVGSSSDDTYVCSVVTAFLSCIADGNCISLG